MEYKVTEVQVGKYDCDTLFIEKDKKVFQVPILKTAKVSSDLIGKTIKIDNLFKVPLEKIVLVTTK